MSYPVIEGLDRSLLDDLFDAQTRFPTGRMGENATSDFILRHVFGIAVELISNDADLLRSLLRLHYGQTKLPNTLIERLVQELEKDNRFQTWSLDAIVSDAQAFFTVPPRTLAAVPRGARQDQPSKRGITRLCFAISRTGLTSV